MIPMRHVQLPLSLIVRFILFLSLIPAAALSAQSWYDYLPGGSRSDVRTTVDQLDADLTEYRTLFAQRMDTVRTLLSRLEQAREAQYRSSVGSDANSSEVKKTHAAVLAALGDLQSFISREQSGQADSLAEKRQRIADGHSRIVKSVRDHQPELEGDAYEKTVHYLLTAPPAFPGAADLEAIYQAVIAEVTGAQDAAAIASFTAKLGNSNSQTSGTPALVVARFEAGQAVKRWWLDLATGTHAEVPSRLSRLADAAAQLDTDLARRARRMARVLDSSEALFPSVKKNAAEVLPLTGPAEMIGETTLTSSSGATALSGFLGEIAGADPRFLALESQWDLLTYAALEATYVSLAEIHHYQRYRFARRMQLAQADLTAAYASARWAWYSVHVQNQLERLRNESGAALSQFGATSGGRDAADQLRAYRQAGQDALDKLKDFARAGAGQSDEMRWAVLAVLANRRAQHLIAGLDEQDRVRQFFEHELQSLYREVDRRVRSRLTGQTPADLTEPARTLYSQVVSRADIYAPLFDAGTQALPYDRTLAVRFNASGSLVSEERSAVTGYIRSVYIQEFYRVTQGADPATTDPAALDQWASTHGQTIVQWLLPEAPVYSELLSGSSEAKAKISPQDIIVQNLLSAAEIWPARVAVADDAQLSRDFLARGLLTVLNVYRDSVEPLVDQYGLDRHLALTFPWIHSVHVLEDLESDNLSPVEAAVALGAIWNVAAGQGADLGLYALGKEMAAGLERTPSNPTGRPIARVQFANMQLIATELEPQSAGMTARGIEKWFSTVSNAYARGALDDAGALALHSTLLSRLPQALRSLSNEDPPIVLSELERRGYLTKEERAAIATEVTRE